MSASDWMWTFASLGVGVLVGYFIGVWHATKQTEALMWQMQMEIQTYARMMMPEGKWIEHEGEDDGNG